MRPTDLVTAKRQIDDFVDYVDSFYGKNDPLYPLVKDGQPLSKVDILGATEKYLSQCGDDNNELCTWGDGDYGWDDYTEDFGEFNEVVEDVEEEVFADTQLSLSGVF